MSVARRFTEIESKEDAALLARALTKSHNIGEACAILRFTDNHNMIGYFDGCHFSDLSVFDCHEDYVKAREDAHSYECSKAYRKVKGIC